MSNNALSVIIDILRELAYIVVYIGSAVAVYLALQRPKVKEWLGPAGGLVRIILFLALTALVDWPLSLIVSDLFSFIEALVGQAPVVYPAARCLGSVVVLIAVAVFIVLLARDSAAEAVED